MNNCENDIVYRNALEKIKHDQKLKPRCCVLVGAPGTNVSVTITPIK